MNSESTYYDAIPVSKGLPENLCKLPDREVIYCYTGLLPGFTDQQIREAFRIAWQAWADVADLSPRRCGYSEKGFHVIHDFGAIDGPTNTLAWSTLPCHGLPVRQVYDIGENWTISETATRGQIDLVTVMIHEIGHALGIEHAPDNSVMYAAYRGPKRVVDGWSAEEAIRRYGPAKKDKPRNGGPTMQDWIELLKQILPLIIAILEILAKRKSGRALTAEEEALAVVIEKYLSQAK